MSTKLSQQDLDRWLPTLVRYSGFALTIALSIEVVVFGRVELLPGYVPAAGMIAYPAVKSAASPEDPKK